MLSNWNCTVASRIASNLLGLLLGCACLPGCMSVLHPIHPPAEVQCIPRMPCAAREHVYVFIVHGVDPLDYANLNGLQRYCQDLGYANTYLGQLFHKGGVYKEVCRVQAQDPEARIVCIGFSAGANVVRDVVRELGAHGGYVDLVVYCGGNTLKDVPESRPENVGKVIHVLATGYVWKGVPLDGAENVRYADVWHFGSPSHPETLRKLAEELATVAGRVPVIATHLEPAEAPRSTQPLQPGWDALKPVSRLRTVDEIAAGTDLAIPAANSGSTGISQR